MIGHRYAKQAFVAVAINISVADGEVIQGKAQHGRTRAGMSVWMICATSENRIPQGFHFHTMESVKNGGRARWMRSKCCDSSYSSCLLMTRPFPRSTDSSLPSPSASIL
jgi:hypothetical protein